MSADILRSEAENCLSYMFQEFRHAAKGIISFPLTDVATCRAFSTSVTKTIAALRNSDSPLPPTALILAMIRLCHAIIDPPIDASTPRVRLDGVPRAFIYEVLDRLHAEVPPTFDFAVDQIGRIMNEAGDLANEQGVRRAFRSYRVRQHGALLSADLDNMVQMMWHRRYPHHSDLLQSAFLREAA